MKSSFIKCLISFLVLVGLITLNYGSASAKIIRGYYKINRPRIINNRNEADAKLPRLQYITGFPDRFRGGRFPQSINLDKGEHNLYIGFDSYCPDGSKVIKYNLWKHSFRSGPTFKGGHAQGVSLNRTTNHLWFVNKNNNNDGDDHAGVFNKGNFVDVSTGTLKPIGYVKIHIKRGYYFNNTLSFSNRGAFISLDTKYHSKKYPYDFVFYHTPVLNLHHNHWLRLDTIIRNVPKTATLEYLSYNPRDKKLYIESETPNEIWSLPVSKLLKNTLKYKDIHMAHIPLKIEPEGITFTDLGYAYLMFGGAYPWQASIYKTDRPVTF